MHRLSARTLIAFSFLMVSPGLSAHAQKVAEKIIYSFCSQLGCSDGLIPGAGLIQGSDGNFYGTTMSGTGPGTVYQLTPSGKLTTLHSFSGGSDGGLPLTPLVQGGDGNFYGVTANGGNLVNCPSDQGCGTIFEITPNGNFSTIYTFCSAGAVNNCTDGANPEGQLVEGSDGNLYGTTLQGGNPTDCIIGGLTLGCGTVFRISPSGGLTTLYALTGGANGEGPYSLLQASDGNFYAVASGGENGIGIIFRLTLSGQFTELFTFPGSGIDGSGPTPSLVEYSDGSFYGATSAQGNMDDCTSPTPAGCGTLFKVTSSGDFTLLYSFTGASDGAYTYSGLLLGSDGNFYGTTNRGGDVSVCASLAPPGCGTVFQMTPSGALSTLYSFQGIPDAQNSGLALVQSSNGEFYGTTLYGGTGADQGGTVFEVSLAPALSAPVQLSLSSSSVTLGGQVTLSWDVLNAFSTTMQQCYAFVQNSAPGAGAWTGLQSGTLSNNIYSGSANLMPTAVGTYTYALTCGGVESRFATLTVNSAPPLTITTTSLPNGTAGTAYSTTLAATGGIPSYSWSLASGTLPAGLSLASSTGVISGTPTQSGTSSFDIAVEDSASTQATANLSITINAAVPAISASPSTITIAAPGGSGMSTISVSGFSSNSLGFTCTGLPSESTCSFGTLSGTGYSGTASLQITTTAPSNSQLAPFGRHGSPIVLALSLPGVMALFGLWPGRRSRRSQLFGLMMVSLVMSAMAGCGGSSSSGPSNPGTPVGTSSVVVTATAGSETASTTISLVVK